ncbi:activated protein kinase catalytic subunit alpha-1 [Seminavis robusta]|uniref:Guanylate cyclase n=1 Tax=Seminavis robusta TaxID=568900 RepID=A0A9N8HA88_9STRA|nr:activated protein kinase catalytic subunit alpha-1 [Seminavis robusta]|eukprot:Sro233_g094150.1 activated protein kinase catalytic subunit alpha-1 (1948) ;mRNA; r:18311-25692
MKSILCSALLVHVLLATAATATATATATTASNNTGSNTTTSSTTSPTSSPGNCVAGGSGFGYAFDWTRPDTISLKWSDIPAGRHTVEYWYRITDLHLTSNHIVSYSAYNVRGYLGQGGQPYEAANELFFLTQPDSISLWRGSGRVTLRTSQNPRVGTIYENEWRHLAYVFNSYTNPPLVQFFLDGQQLDFASTQITLTTNGTHTDADSGSDSQEVTYEKAPFSNDWDLPEHPDANEYYGVDQQKQVKVVENPCLLAEKAERFQWSDVVWVPLQSTTSTSSTAECTREEQALLVAAAGAYALVFEKNSSEPLFVEDDTTASNAGSFRYTKFFIPVIAITTPTIVPTHMNFTRTKDPLSYAPDFSGLVEPNGVLALGQEPDRPWGDFDPQQAANGCLDEFRVWSSARTPQQIKDNYKLAIDTNTDPTAKDLHLYWNFNQPTQGALSLTTDSSPNGTHPGLVGNLPTIANEMTFSNGDPKAPPTPPLRIPTQACPLVGYNQEVVVAVNTQAPNAFTTFELKSFDPDGDDLITTLLSIPPPELGTLHSTTSSEPLAVGDIVTDLERTENKRVVFVVTADNNNNNNNNNNNTFAQGITFQYQVQDKTLHVSTATVRLVPHVVEEPNSKNITIPEDKLSYFSLGRPSQITQALMQVVITQLPQRGTLYQAQFNPNLRPAYTSIALSLNQYGEMQAITEPQALVENERGIVMYLPETNAASATPDEIFDTFAYKFVDTASGLESATEATLGISVQAVNDAPASINASAVVIPGEQQDTAVVLTLTSTDVDLDAAESFATRPYARVTHFPLLGQLYQYNASSSDEDEDHNNNKGAYLDPSVTAVPQTFAWASNVLRYSSQYSQCGAACYEWRNPDCTSTDLLSGGWETGSCSATGWHASGILGPPDVYPVYVDSKNSWDLSEENEGHEWIELEFPFPVFINAFEVYETHKPGSVWRISTTGEYLDDPDETCIRETCSTKTKWQTLWTKPQETVTSGFERATIFSPPLCPSTVKSNLVRMDIDTSRALGWNGFDAAKVTGSLAAPPGLVNDPSNRLVYAPLTGVHGVDQFSFASSDCLGEGEDAIFTVTIEAPAGVNDNVFYQQELIFPLEPGQVESIELDLSQTLENIQEVLQREPTNLTAAIAFTNALGSNEDAFVNISLTDPNVTLELGVERRGAPFSHVDIWFLDNELGRNMTFRVRYWILPQLECVNGIEDIDQGICICTSSQWTGEVCSEEVSNEVNLGLAIGMPIAAVLIVGLITYFYCEGRRKQNDSVWHVKKEELKFGDPPEIVGRGTFGVVLLAEYRGTQVAVKRVIPPKSSGKKDDRLDITDHNDSTHRSGSKSSAGLQSGSFGRSSAVGALSGMNLVSGATSMVGMGSMWMTSMVGGGSQTEQMEIIQRKRMKLEFIEEMRYLSKLRHPCVTTIMGAVLGKDPMLVMEYMDHGSLYDLLHNETMVIEGDLLVNVLRDISQGIRFLHSATPQVIHGDLKAANILVDTKFRAKVADFGLSQKQNLGGTGTPFWMAPELLRGESANTAESDIYSFGMILFEVYSRRDPYEDEDAHEVLRLVADRQVMKRPPVPRYMPEKMKSLMTDCLDDNPEQRPSSEEVDVRIKRMDVKNVDPGQANVKASSASLFDVFPRHIAEALRDGRTPDPDHRDSVTIFFSDIVGFTNLSATLEPRKVAQMLDRLYTKLDALTHKHDIFKVETIGDAYMAVTNLVKEQDDDHARRIALFAIDAIAAANDTIIDADDPAKGHVNIRVGFHSGSVVGDVVGTRAPRYCLFGDTVNTASRMESNSEVNRIHCSRAAAQLLHTQCPDLPLTSRGKISVKGKGKMHTYWVNEGGSTRRKGSSFFDLNDSFGVISTGMDDSDIEAPPPETIPKEASNKRTTQLAGATLENVPEEPEESMEFFSDEFDVEESFAVEVPEPEMAPPPIIAPPLVVKSSLSLFEDEIEV